MAQKLSYKIEKLTPVVKIIQTQEFGRGLYATRLINSGEVIEQCEVLVLSANDTFVVNDLTDLKYYTFKYDQERDCLVLGLGEIFNHSDTENVSYGLIERDGRHLMQFTATKDIQSGDQLFINYTADQLVDTSKYTKSLVG